MISINLHVHVHVYIAKAKWNAVVCTASQISVHVHLRVGLYVKPGRLCKKHGLQVYRVGPSHYKDCTDNIDHGS